MKAASTGLMILLFVLGLLYLGAELMYSAVRDRSQFSGVESMARIVRLVFAAPLLLLPIFQFSARIRTAKPGVHRTLGRFYMISAIVAALGALYLGFTFEEPGRRPPLTIFACLWLYFSSAAWLAAYRKDFRTHAKFVIRSYGVALAFVLVRILGQLDPIIFAFMPNEDVRGITREWLSFVIPLLIIEASLTWMPASRATRGHPNKAAANQVWAGSDVQPRA